MSPDDLDPPPEYCALSKCLNRGYSKYRCAGCERTYYCSVRHKNEDAQHHRAQCRIPTPPPLPQTGLHSHSVLLFPTDEDAPRVVQLECRTGQESQIRGERDHHIHLASLLGENPYSWMLVPVGSIERSTPPTRLYLAFNNEAHMTRLPRNRSAQRLTEGQPRPVEWRGTLVGYRSREPGSEVTQFVDVSMNDLPVYTAYLKEHGTPIHPQPVPARADPPVIVADQRPQSETSLHLEPQEKPSEDKATVTQEEPQVPPATPAEHLARKREGEGRMLLLMAVVAALAVYGAFHCVVLPIIGLSGTAISSLSSVLRFS
ncbi:hypothetical protein OH77DRAFT_1408127 [Trametes cingulata]|nr:hypothetical protein OH77DRAFT_1408127 [Trametes cingulata]